MLPRACRKLIIQPVHQRATGKYVNSSLTAETFPYNICQRHVICNIYAILATTVNVRRAAIRSDNRNSDSVQIACDVCDFGRNSLVASTVVARRCECPSPLAVPGGGCQRMYCARLLGGRSRNELTLWFVGRLISDCVLLQHVAGPMTVGQPARTNHLASWLLVRAEEDQPLCLLLSSLDSLPHCTKIGKS